FQRRGPTSSPARTPSSFSKPAATPNETTEAEKSVALPAAPAATPATVASPTTSPGLRPPGDPFRRGFRMPLRAFMRTTDPVQYWLLASGRLDSPLLGDPMRIVLVARSETISGGGLILNPRPWLLLGCGIILFSLLFWWPLVASITRTIRRMMQTTRQ